LDKVGKIYHVSLARLKGWAVEDLQRPASNRATPDRGTIRKSFADCAIAATSRGDKGDSGRDASFRVGSFQRKKTQ